MTLRKAGTILTVLAAAAGIATGQPPGGGQPGGGDPPSRVARLNFIQGQVSFRPGSVEEWTNASLNYPLYNGDHLWADMGAQTELHIGSTAIRMGSETALAILSLDDRMVQLSMTGGVLNVHLRALGDGESFEVDTPNSAVTLLRPGDYRFQVDGNANLTVVSVHSGDAEVSGGGRAFAVHARDSARITGMDDNIGSELTAIPGFDGFDRWCQDRDRREEQSQSVRHVSREMIGYEDLDEHGVWSEVPDYGWVWRPRAVAAGWAPYRFGHWVWVEPWGWTWVDDAPWGFAPFHYGRWAMYGGGWVWVPGTVVARPVYAPALVAFVGGPRFNVAVSFGGGGGVAWFPLGPHEVYRPAYHVSEVYVRQVNITHVNVTNINVTNVNVTNVRYVNQTQVTAVSQSTFVSARPVHTAVVAVPANAVAQAQVVGTAAPIAPQRASVLGRPAAVGNVAAPPARMADRAVVAKATPPPPPVSFAAKQNALQANPGRPVDPAMAESLRRNNSNNVRGPMVRPAMPVTNVTNRPVTPPTPNRPVNQQAMPAVTTTQPPHNDRPVVRQPQPEMQVQRQPVQRQPVQQQPATQNAQPPRGEPRQEVRAERNQEERKDQHKVDKKGNKEEKKEEKKQQR